MYINAICWLKQTTILPGLINYLNLLNTLVFYTLEASNNWSLKHQPQLPNLFNNPQPD